MLVSVYDYSVPSPACPAGSKVQPWELSFRLDKPTGEASRVSCELISKLLLMPGKLAGGKSEE